MSISKSAPRVQDVAKERGFAFEAIEWPDSTRTADHPPIRHTQPMQVFIDADLLPHEEVGAAAGTPDARLRFTGKMPSLVQDGRMVAAAGKRTAAAA